MDTNPDTKTINVTLKIKAARVRYMSRPAAHGGRMVTGWDATTGTVEVRQAPNLKSLREQLHAGVQAAVEDAWVAPWTWVDIGGQAWTVYLADADQVGIVRVVIGRMGSSNRYVHVVQRRREWDEQPWMYLVHDVETNMQRMFDAWGRMARGETTGTCTTCLTNLGTVVRDETGAFECPSPGCRAHNPGPADRDAEQAVVVAACAKCLRVTRTDGRVFVWNGYGYGDASSTVVTAFGGTVWTRGDDGTYGSASLADGLDVIRKI